MPIVIKTGFNAFQEVEKLLHYKWWDKGRERSNRAKGFWDTGAIAKRCVMHHDQIAYTGPPDDKVRAYVCLRCHGVACEPEIKYMGWEFDTIVLENIHQIMDSDLIRQARGTSKTYGGLSGR